MVAYDVSLMRRGTKILGPCNNPVAGTLVRGLWGPLGQNRGAAPDRPSPPIICTEIDMFFYALRSRSSTPQCCPTHHLAPPLRCFPLSLPSRGFVVFKVLDVKRCTIVTVFSSFVGRAVSVARGVSEYAKGKNCPWPVELDTILAGHIPTRLVTVASP